MNSFFLRDEEIEGMTESKGRLSSSTRAPRVHERRRFLFSGRVLQLIHRSRGQRALLAAWRRSSRRNWKNLRERYADRAGDRERQRTLDLVAPRWIVGDYSQKAPVASSP